MQYMKNLRSDGKPDILVLGIKDQNYCGKVYLCGRACTDNPALVKSVTAALVKSSPEAHRGTDDFDVMWDLAWHGTKITSGMQAFSFTKPYFPRGKAVVGLLDALSEHGWTPTAAPNFGGPISDKASADWPAIIFGKEGDKYTKESLFLAVKDQNVPGKLCAAGPQGVISSLKTDLTKRLKALMPDIRCEHDGYDTLDDWDAVWLDTSITSGCQAFSLAKPYFPKGKICIAILEEVYKLGWRLVAAPNFGGNDVDWPCMIFRCLAAPADAPPILMGAIKDQNMPGKLCLAGRDASAVAQSLAEGLKTVEGNGSVRVQKDEYDDDWDQVLRETKLTNGLAAFSFSLAYFPRNDAVMAVLSKMNQLGWSLAGCPNFGGLGASWPTFIWEKRDENVRSAFIAIKDQNIPGKVCFGGGLQSDGVHDQLLKGFKGLAGEQVESFKDTWDQDFDFSFCDTKMTSGSVPCSMQNAWWPFGFPIEMVLSEMGAKGWKAVGGPNFGAGRLSWSALVLEKSAVEKAPPTAEI
eukprot:CAMPEP_0171173872 /NCGR_PEP_ID=MMETSP0790-20130122/10441_1 /TAXON_ID=2925 /ORGANISM="Alexandrium catenella, Strain OF101" /LENGTH=521 /DNA_ID=CAMNT_0011638739 /DNA_START=91 /DNA_END=1656 /DNA_ORIENTATION=-